MSSRDASTIVEDAQDYIDDEGGLGMFIVNIGIGGIVMSMIYGAIDTVESAFQLLYLPIQSFAVSLSEVVLAAIGGQADIVTAAIDTAVQAFTSGATAMLGPAAPIAAIFVIGAMTWLLVEIWSRIPISPLTFVMDKAPWS